MISGNASPEMRAPGQDRGIDSEWVFPDNESAERKFRMEINRIQALRKSNEGRQELMQRMHEVQPSLNGRAERVLNQVDTNLDELNKKESFLTKVGNMSLHAAESVGKTIIRHPFLTILALLGGYAALTYGATGAFAAAAEVEELGFKNAVEKAIQLMKTNAPLATGAAGAGTEATNMITPDTF